MALGVPVVSTSIGAQGLTVESGTQMLIADDPEGFADGIIQLLLNPAASQEMTNKRGLMWSYTTTSNGILRSCLDF
jgi:glycosyltransferase involved in cell wall biosynthesis